MVLPAGVKYNHRFYDSIELQPFRNQPSNDVQPTDFTRWGID